MEASATQFDFDSFQDEAELKSALELSVTIAEIEVIVFLLAMP